jgi:hypothetical protein
MASDNPFANGKSADGSKPYSQSSSQWWKAPRKDKDDPLGYEVARWLTNVALKLETAQIQQRWRSLVFYRHFTGRPTSAQFAYGMAKRPSAYTYYRGFGYSPPTYNLIASCADVYVNRLLRQQMFMSIVPERGNFGQRQQSKMIQMWVEAGLHEIGFWQAMTKMGLDGLCYGSGVLKIAETMAKKIGCFRVHRDELLYDNEDEDDPNSCIQRVWANREDVLDRYGTSREIREAIEKCDSAYPAFYFGNGVLDTSNVIPLLAGYRRKRVTGRPGRYVLAVQNYTIADEPYDDDELPFIQWDWHQLPSGIFGKGLAETLLRVNEEIDRLFAADTENAMRGGWPKVLAHADSGVNPAALGDTSYAIVKWSGQPWMKPEYVEPPTMGEQNGARIERLIKYGKEMAHISDQAMQGRQVSGAGASAVAREKESQIDDANFAEMGGRLEKVAEQATYKLIKLGKKLKPSFTMPGRRRQLIKWEAVQILDSCSVGIEAIGMSRFPQTMSGRQEILDSMLANGTISREMHTRWSQVPDVDGLQDRLNAPHDAIDKMLDEILSTGEYQPPLPFMDLDYAKVAAEAFYMLEYAQGTPQDALDNVLAWRAAVMELIVQRDTPDDVTVVAPPGVTPPGPGASANGAPAPPPAPGFGDQQSGNVPLAPSPAQIPPTMPLPQ